MTICLRVPFLSAAIAVASLLSACGGGGGGSSPAATATVSGTAATGVAIASGTVTLKCVGGTSGAVTTNVDGSFSIDVSSVTLPCVGRVDYKDGTGTARKLHTFIKAVGTANITPVTELLVASLTGAAAANAFDNFDGTAVKGFTAVQIKAAADAVKAYLQTVLGVDTGNLGDDPIGIKFTAKTGSSDGDKFDKILDDLKTKLATAGKQLADAESDVSKPAIAATSSAGTLTVSDASNHARNGSYAPTGAKFTSGTDTGFNGQTADGKFEMEVTWTSSNTIKRAHIWFFDSGNAIKFFGCDGQAVPCTGVAYSAALDEVSFTHVAFVQVGDPFSSSTDTPVNGGETLGIDGKLSVK